MSLSSTPYETTKALKEADDYNDHQRKCAILKNALRGGEHIDSYEGKGGSERYGDDYRSNFGKGRPTERYKANEYEWRDGRMRKVTKVHKKYQTKPKIHAKIHRNKYGKITQS